MLPRDEWNQAQAEATRARIARDTIKHRDHRIRELEAENLELRNFAFGDAPEWKKANSTLKHRVRELEAELAQYRPEGS